jgi:hypothetical protein
VTSVHHTLAAKTARHVVPNSAALAPVTKNPFLKMQISGASQSNIVAPVIFALDSKSDTIGKVSLASEFE